MNKTADAVIQNICHRIEERYPDTVAGFRDFISPALLPVDEDEPVTVHVFCLASVDYNEVYDYVQALVLTAGCDHDVHPAFAIWNRVQSLDHFADDVERLQLQRALPEVTTCATTVEIADLDVDIARLLAWSKSAMCVSTTEIHQAMRGRWLLSDEPQSVTRDTALNYGMAA